MNKILMFIKRLFLAIDSTFIFKSYVFSGILFYFIGIKGMLGSMNFGFGDVITIIWLLVATIVFPLCNVVWNDLISALFGGFIVILPLPIMAFWKFFKYLMLWFVAPIVAPIGIIYILLNQKLFEKYNC